VARMIDPVTGEIRPEFANDPDLAEWAAWAKSKFDQTRSDDVLARARAFAGDPTLSERAKANQIEDAVSGAGFEGLLQTAEGQDLSPVRGAVSSVLGGEIEAAGKSLDPSIGFGGS